jgi:hypothetical protein
MAAVAADALVSLRINLHIRRGGFRRPLWRATV